MILNVLFTAFAFPNTTIQKTQMYFDCILINFSFFHYRWCCQWFLEQVGNPVPHFGRSTGSSRCDSLSWFGSWFSRKFRALKNQLSWGSRFNDRRPFLYQGRINSKRRSFSKAPKSIQSEFDFFFRSKLLWLAKSVLSTLLFTLWFPKIDWGTNLLELCTRRDAILL